jgi:hypothetical protein
MTCHASGVIAISLAEADDATRERNRVRLGEHYRTLLGHFRHEIGHYYWGKLMRDGDGIESCRIVFGDDSRDYAAALQRHYAQGYTATGKTVLSAHAPVCTLGGFRRDLCALSPHCRYARNGQRLRHSHPPQG